MSFCPLFYRFLDLSICTIGRSCVQVCVCVRAVGVGAFVFPLCEQNNCYSVFLLSWTHFVEGPSLFSEVRSWSATGLESCFRTLLFKSGCRQRSNLRKRWPGWLRTYTETIHVDVSLFLPGDFDAMLSFVNTFSLSEMFPSIFWGPSPFFFWPLLLAASRMMMRWWWCVAPPAAEDMLAC